MSGNNLDNKRNIVDKYVRSLSKYAGDIKFVDDTLFVAVPRHVFREAVKLVHNEFDCYLRTCAGVDERPLNGFFAMYYIFGDDRNGLNIVLKVYADPSKPVFPSVIDICPAVDWCEMEAHDLLGLEFEGRQQYRLVLPNWWPKNLYPLRKDVPHNIRPKPSLTGERISVGRKSSSAPIPVGPYHPALHEPEYFELYVEGEKVVDVKYRGFHVHRGIEKLGETRMTYQQVTFLAERICGICGFVHSTCYCQAVEKAARIDVPERALFIRSIILEIERIHSHLLWVGVAAHLLGYDTGFMHSWRIREHVMYLAELLTGSRKTYGINLIGGVRKDINEDKIPKTLEVLSTIEKEFARLVDTMISVPEIKLRLKETGILPKEDARKLSVVGPTARGSGLDRDNRRDLPYAAYKYVDFNVPVYDEGDNLARTLVRVNEVFESIKIIRQLIEQLPKGPIMAEDVDIPENRMAVSLVEAPRGEDIHFVITGYGKPYRWKVRAPTYQNIPALKVMLNGVMLADAPLTIASIDPCFSCTDRIVVVKSDGRKEVLHLPSQWGGMGCSRH